VVRRRTLAASAAAVVLAYAGLAAWSGHLSPLARGPLLDGLGPPQAYRWVSPPPDLAATNVEPSNLTGSMPLTPKGVAGASFVSSDSQLTVIVKDGAIAPHGHDTSVSLEATPVDPATLAPLEGDLKPFGNAYRIAFTYLPSKVRVTRLRDPLDVLLAYPYTVTLHAANHGLYASRDGKNWTPARSNDLLAAFQVEGPVPEPGYVVVGGVPTPAPVSTSPGGGSAGTNAVATGLFVVAGVALLVGIGLVLRGRKRG
jgi:hypothetical protein